MLSGLPEPMLLDAAHIIPDTDECWGQPVEPNGIPLSTIHHAAFAAHLIGVDPDYRIHVPDRLLSQNDGPMARRSEAPASWRSSPTKKEAGLPGPRPARHAHRPFQGCCINTSSCSLP